MSSLAPPYLLSCGFSIVDVRPWRHSTLAGLDVSSADLVRDDSLSSHCPPYPLPFRRAFTQLCLSSVSPVTMNKPSILSLDLHDLYQSMS